MELENNIKGIIGNKLKDGTIERIIEDELEKGIQTAISNIWGRYGDGTKVIEDNIKSVMIPYLEKYDYSKYIVKLDAVMVEILKNASLENKKILENFKELTVQEGLKEINTSTIFEKYCEYVSENIDTYELKVCTDDYEPSYEDVRVNMEIEYEENRGWSSYEYCKIILECEEDEGMNTEIRLSKFENEEGYTITDKRIDNINSLRYLDEFNIYLMKLDQFETSIIIDEEYMNEDIEVKAEPEVSYSFD